MIKMVQDVVRVPPAPVLPKLFVADKKCRAGRNLAHTWHTLR